jgi:hypothetical protein
VLTLPTESSDVFPTVAKAATEALVRAKIAGVDVTSSQVSIEVVQLSIECTDRSTTCYDAVARQLDATKLLFAQVEADGGKPKITVTLFDRGTAAPKQVARTYATEAAAVAGLDGLVAEVTK